MRRYLFGGVLPALLALVVLAAPAAASASPKLEYAGGGEVPVGASVKAASTNLQFISGTGNIECGRDVLEGPLAANTGSNIVDEVTSTSFTSSSGSSKCFSTIASGTVSVVINVVSMPLCLSSTTLGSATLRPCGSSPFELNLQLYNSSNVLLCNGYYGLEKLEATYSKGTSPLTLTMNSGSIVKRSGNVICPSSFRPSGYFTVTSGGNQLKIS
jgi:hypothetical protein